MSMLKRFKKRGGFQQLLAVLETTSRSKQLKILDAIRAENPKWESELKGRLLSLDRILSWNDVYQTEVFLRVPSENLAAVISALPEQKRSRMQSALYPRQRHDVNRILERTTVSTVEINKGIRAIYSEVRKMEREGRLKFRDFDPSLETPDDIDVRLTR